MATLPSRTLPLPNGHTITLRSAVPNDALAFLGFARQIMGEGFHSVTEPEEFNVTEEQERSWIQGLNDNPNALMIVAEHQGQIVGELNFQGPHQRRIRHTGNLAMSVHRDWRRQGIGRLLLETLLAWATQHPEIEKVNLAVIATNTKAIRLYEQLGFQVEGKRPREVRFAPDHYADVLLMYKYVKPISP